MDPSPQRGAIKNPSKRFSESFWLSDKMLIGYIALANLILRLIAIKGYGIFRDELYYIACSEHLAFGYVDQPPLSLFILKGVRLLLGDSLFALRILPVLGGALYVYLAGWIAKELGGKKFAMVLAATAAFASIGTLFSFNYYSMNYLDILFWQFCILIVLRIIKTQNPKYWLLFGLAAGLGLQNKISVLFICFGLVVGLLLTRERKHFRSRYLWMGAGIAALIFLPCIIWNMTHDWAMLEFIHNARTVKMSEVTPVGFFMGQLLYNNPPTLFIWIVGIGFFIFSRFGRAFRIFGWAFLAIYILFTMQGAKDYYLAGGYPVLFAGGAVLWEHWLKKRHTLWFKILLFASLIIPTYILAPMALPILPEESLIKLQEKIGIEHDSGEIHEIGILPQHFADMHGWEDMARTFAEIYGTLSSEDKADCMIYVRNYGEAGAIDFYGQKYGLPGATCTHNSYWLWGPPEWSGRTAIILGVYDNLEENLEDLSVHFEEVTYAATIICPYCMPYENNRHIFICRRARGPITDIEAFWEQEKHFN